MPSHRMLIYAAIFIIGYLASELGPDILPFGKHY